SLLFSCYCSSRSLHSFPTRRSSDLSITASLPHFRQIRRYTLFTSHSAQEPITGQILPGVFFSLVPVGQTANFIQHAHNTQESMVLLRPDAIRIKNFQDTARFPPRITILPLFPLHQLADLHSLLNVIACIKRRLAARRAFVPHKWFRLCIKLRNNAHFFAAVMTLHFLTSSTTTLSTVTG